MRADSGRRSDFEIFRAREMRRYPTDAERKLWQLLRGKRLGVRFRRQQPIGPYVVDFYCSLARLIVELDGEQHGFDARREYDEQRTRWLEQHGYRVVRFWNVEVFRNEERVIEQILAALVECGGKLAP
jgi:very-short-patch-repair endonuclease